MPSTPSSMSSSSADVAISVVVADNEAQQLVPEQWRDGIDDAEGDVVCLTISVMRPADGWVDTARRLAADADAVGGAIEPGDDLRLRDWAEYFCRYARDMLPFAARETVDLPGDNAVYTRAALAATRDVYRDGFWELEVNRAPAGQGLPAVAFTRARRLPGPLRRIRLLHAPAPGARPQVRPPARRPLLDRAGTSWASPAAVVVPAVLLARTFREVFSRRRLRVRLVTATPLLLAYDVAWAVGEAAGHLDSLRGR